MEAWICKACGFGVVSALIHVKSLTGEKEEKYYCGSLIKNTLNGCISEVFYQQDINNKNSLIYSIGATPCHIADPSILTIADKGDYLYLDGKIRALSSNQIKPHDKQVPYY